jgi:hypothetical protein
VNGGWRAWFHHLLVPGITTSRMKPPSRYLQRFPAVLLAITNMFSLVLMPGNSQPGMVLVTFLGASLLGVVSLIPSAPGRCASSIYLAGIWFGVSLLSFRRLGGLSSASSELTC